MKDREAHPASASPRLTKMILSRFESISLLLTIIVAGGGWAFIAIADEVTEGSMRTFDETVLLAMHPQSGVDQPAGPSWLENAARDCTALGSWSVLVLIVIVVAVYLFMQRRSRFAILLLAASITGTIVTHVLKAAFARPRPDLVHHGDFVFTASFPSGHAMMAATVYLTLGSLLMRSVKPLRLKIYALTTAMFLTLIVGVSRVYLGVHWPSDVLAGWAAGATWATLCWLIARWLQAHGDVESESSELLAGPSR